MPKASVCSINNSSGDIFTGTTDHGFGGTLTTNAIYYSTEVRVRGRMGVVKTLGGRSPAS